MFAHVIDGAARKGRRVGVLVHRRELARQAADKLALAGVPHGILAAGLDRDHDAPVLVMSVQTAVRRLDRLPDLDFIVSTKRIIAPPELGAGARPLAARQGPRRHRHAGEARRQARARRRVFDHLTIGATVPELQAGGFLARSRVFCSGSVDRHPRRTPTRRGFRRR